MNGCQTCENSGYFSHCVSCQAGYELSSGEQRRNAASYDTCTQCNAGYDSIGGTSQCEPACMLILSRRQLTHAGVNGMNGCQTCENSGYFSDCTSCLPGYELVEDEFSGDMRRRKAGASYDTCTQCNAGYDSEGGTSPCRPACLLLHS
jgi:hypothetical protein